MCGRGICEIRASVNIYEENLSAKSKTQKQAPWLFKAHAKQGRPERAGQPQAKRKKETDTSLKKSKLEALNSKFETNSKSRKFKYLNPGFEFLI